MTARSAAFDLRETKEGAVLALSGDWTVWTIADAEPRLREAGGRLKPGSRVDVSAVGKVDIAGAYVIDRIVRQHVAAREAPPVALVGEDEAMRRLVAVAREALRTPHPPPARMHGFVALLDRVGRAAANFAGEALETLSFMGQTLATMGRMIAQPRRMRWPAMVHVMETAGLNAITIIALLSFFIGVVIAYLGARVLRDFGATIFTVELVAFSMLREFGVVITAVLLAGRTDSAFTAELGAMKMRQEVDALRVLGVDPIEALVAPRVLAMLVMTPLLTFIAVMAGLLGGMLVCWAALDVSPVLFVNRIHDNVPVRHFWVGMVKAPVFALVVALVGCRHGLEVGGDVVSLGRRVTASVVQAIFLVIVLDALFAVWFMEMDI
jgi:phospholipid/cholesterol/gamma-HCH transport system permease protein